MILIFSEKIHVARVINQNFVFGPPAKKVAHACRRRFDNYVPKMFTYNFTTERKCTSRDS